MDNRFVYMDYNATTPLRDEVKARMIEDFEIFANASSMHEAGRRARDRVEKARAQVAALIGAADPQTLLFTSGGSESNNTVFNTMYDLGRGPRGRAQDRDDGDRAPLRDERREAPVGGGLPRRLPRRRRPRQDRPERAGARARPGAVDGRSRPPRVRDGRQQRDRDGAGHEGHLRPRQGRGSLLPYRRRAGRGQDGRRRLVLGRRLPHPLLPQDLRAQGRRRPLRPQGSPGRAPDPRRPPGAGHQGRHLQQSGHPRLRPRRRARGRATSIPSPSGFGPFAKGSRRAFPRAFRTSGSTAIRPRSCPIRSTCPSPARRARPSSSPSTSRASRCPRARPAPRAVSSRATCSWRRASGPRWPTAPSGSAWGAAAARRTSTTSSRSCPRSSSACGACRPSRLRSRPRPAGTERKETMSDTFQWLYSPIRQGAFHQSQERLRSRRGFRGRRRGRRGQYKMRRPDDVHAEDKGRPHNRRAGGRPTAAPAP